jgi:hypothetical protein
MREQAIHSLFKKMLDSIHRRHKIKLDTILVIDWDGDYPKTRDYAQTNSVSIWLSPKALKAPRHRVEGILRHEFGHVLLMKHGDFDHSERDADITAEACFGGKILYDSDGVQSTKFGVSPRPEHLPKY